MYLPFSHLQEQHHQQQNQGRNSYAAVKRDEPPPPLHPHQHRRTQLESHLPSSPTPPAHSSTPSSPTHEHTAVDERAHLDPPNSLLPIITGLGKIHMHCFCLGVVPQLWSLIGELLKMRRSTMPCCVRPATEKGNRR